MVRARECIEKFLSLVQMNINRYTPHFIRFAAVFIILALAAIIYDAASRNERSASNPALEVYFEQSELYDHIEEASIKFPSDDTLDSEALPN